MGQDRIERQIVLKAPRERVWRALVTRSEFGAWFGARLEGADFSPGERVRGPISFPGYEHWTLEMTIERVEGERLLSWRWHPYAQPGEDHSGEPTTLVELRLEDVPGGTRLTVVESGFDRLAAARRAKAFEMNDGGWAAQLKNVERHVAA
jgi:uncharacterized protein YndB with AHSA1/START domain